MDQTRAEKILETLRTANPEDLPMTGAEIARRIGAVDGRDIGGTLRLLSERSMIFRRARTGPRGGAQWGWTTKRKIGGD